METHTRSKSSLNSPDTLFNCISTPKVDKLSNGALLFQQGYMRKKDIEEILKVEELKCQKETLKESKTNQMIIMVYSLQAQINALRTKNEQLNTRLTSHLNDKQGHEQKVGGAGGEYD